MASGPKNIRARDIREQVDRIYAGGRFWPEPIVSINPHFQVGDSISKLVAEGTLHEKTEQVFQIDGQALTLFRHQSQAIAKAEERRHSARYGATKAHSSSVTSLG